MLALRLIRGRDSLTPPMMTRHASTDRFEAAYKHVSTHASVEDALVAVHSYDGCQYVVAYNYGPLGNGKVFRCVSHEHCPVRIRMVELRDEDEEIPVTYRLGVIGGHGNQVTNKKRLGVDLAVRGEVDALLTAGTKAKQCRQLLLNKYRNQPFMLEKVPNEKQLHNRRLTLVKNGHIEKSKAKRSRTRSPQSDVSEGEADYHSSTSMFEDEESEYHEPRLAVRRRQDDSELDVERAGVFDKTKLMHEFATLPGRPVLWNVLKSVKYIDDKSGMVVTQWLTGQVTGWETREHTPIKWVVRFTDDEKRQMELEELVDVIGVSMELGLNVTGRPHGIQIA
ncbi:unnamed protein product [Phytophthora fragariaefolia]|uniref:Unnamed protein product n=1 Tax=Phytophthora fragariaefolia TaxID=1490495 RepID=A0A9W6XBG0_9STRA|nr:unnamed protein product [Phytophthora fragariaefolia]